MSTNPRGFLIGVDFRLNLPPKGPAQHYAWVEVRPELIRYFDECGRNLGRTPTLQEIGDTFNRTSTWSYGVLKRLRAEGFEINTSRRTDLIPDRHLAVFDVYQDFVREHLRPPTLEELGDACGFSKERARQILNSLRDAGYQLQSGGAHKHRRAKNNAMESRFHTLIAVAQSLERFLRRPPTIDELAMELDISTSRLRQLLADFRENAMPMPDGLLARTTPYRPSSAGDLVRAFAVHWLANHGRLPAFQEIARRLSVSAPTVRSILTDMIDSRELNRDLLPKNLSGHRSDRPKRVALAVVEYREEFGREPSLRELASKTGIPLHGVRHAREAAVFQGLLEPAKQQQLP